MLARAAATLHQWIRVAYNLADPSLNPDWVHLSFSNEYKSLYRQIFEYGVSLYLSLKMHFSGFHVFSFSVFEYVFNFVFECIFLFLLCLSLFPCMSDTSRSSFDISLDLPLDLISIKFPISKTLDLWPVL